ncbi:transcriptional regulator [Aerococcus agrisoli]|uniref:Transcriptional regulator n=1 Tax=Aerococcus agrisoli TaxID=2487350 RepID=A0A3N4GGN8_9LACT|nr:LCP family protein [Aerococcus agrisoli]RPA57770.1 transcriptional regulator [Aerococcus agrisoli]
MTQQDNQNKNEPTRKQVRKSSKPKWLVKLMGSKWMPKNKRTYWILGSATLLVILCAIAFKLYADVTGFGTKIYEDVNSNELRDADAQLQNGEPITILLTGIDNGALYYEDVEEARTDVMMVFTINPTTNESTVISIPRDALGPQSDTEDFDKLNHAYMNYDGIEGTINSLQQYLDVPIDYYVNVNMQGFMDVIDALGGVEVTPTLTFTQNGVSFTEGETTTLSGLEAMQYVRMRKSDPEGDIGREKRQQQLVEAVVDKVISLGTITNYNDILYALGDNVKTNVSVENMFALQEKYLSAMDNLEKLVFENYEDLNLDFGYYLLVPELERQEIVAKMQANLDYEGQDAVIVYPVSFGVTSTYFPVTDLNWDGVLTDDEMAIKPGVYSREDLNELVKYIFGYSINDYLTSMGTTDLVNETDDQTIPDTLSDELLSYITDGFDPGAVESVSSEDSLSSEVDTTTDTTSSSTVTDDYQTTSSYSETVSETYSEPAYTSESETYYESSSSPAVESSTPATAPAADPTTTSSTPVTSETPATGGAVTESSASE